MAIPVICDKLACDSGLFLYVLFMFIVIWLLKVTLKMHYTLELLDDKHTIPNKDTCFFHGGQPLPTLISSLLRKVLKCC